MRKAGAGWDRRLWRPRRTTSLAKPCRPGPGPTSAAAPRPTSSARGHPRLGRGSSIRPCPPKGSRSSSPGPPAPVSAVARQRRVDDDGRRAAYQDETVKTHEEHPPAWRPATDVRGRDRYPRVPDRVAAAWGQIQPRSERSGRPGRGRRRRSCRRRCAGCGSRRRAELARDLLVDLALGEGGAARRARGRQRAARPGTVRTRVGKLVQDLAQRLRGRLRARGDRHQPLRDYRLALGVVGEHVGEAHDAASPWRRRRGGARSRRRSTGGGSSAGQHTADQRVVDAELRRSGACAARGCAQASRGSGPGSPGRRWTTRPADVVQERGDGQLVALGEAAARATGRPGGRPRGGGSAPGGIPPRRGLEEVVDLGASGDRTPEGLSTSTPAGSWRCRQSGRPLRLANRMTAIVSATSDSTAATISRPGRSWLRAAQHFPRGTRQNRGSARPPRTRPPAGRPEWPPLAPPAGGVRACRVTLSAPSCPTVSSQSRWMRGPSLVYSIGRNGEDLFSLLARGARAPHRSARASLAAQHSRATRRSPARPWCR